MDNRALFSRIGGCWHKGNANALEHVLAEAGTANAGLQQESKGANETHYVLAFGHFRYSCLEQAGTAKRLEHLALSLEHLSRVNPSESDVESEVYALAAGVYGIEIRIAAGHAKNIKTKFSKALSRAKKLNPKNGRAFFVEGVSLISVPALFGGGKKNALVHLRKAADLLESETSALPYNWGLDECYSWIGRILNSSNDVAGATVAYRTALLVNPDLIEAKNFLALHPDSRQLKSTGT